MDDQHSRKNQENEIIGVDIVKETYPPLHSRPLYPGIKFRDCDNGHEFVFQNKKFKKLDKLHVQAWHEPTQQYVVVSHIPPDFVLTEKDEQISRIIVPGQEGFVIGS